MQEGIGEQPPDLPMQDLIDIKLQPLRDRPGTRPSCNRPGSKGHALRDEHDDVDDDQPFDNLAAAAKAEPGTGAVRPIVVAIINSHGYPAPTAASCSRCFITV